MTENELRTAMECVKIHRGAVAMMKGEYFHMAVVNSKKEIIGTVKCDKDGESRFFGA